MGVLIAVPSSLLADRGVMLEAVRGSRGAEDARFGPAAIFKLASEDLQGDRELILEAIRAGDVADVLAVVPKAARADRTILLEAVRGAGPHLQRVLDMIPEQFRNDPE